MMDVPRPDIRRKRIRLQLIGFGGGALVISVAGIFVSRMKPALPQIDRATVWIDTVKRGPMQRQVRGPGSLVPREDRIRLIPAETEATVVRILVLPGAVVESNTLLMNLVDPTLAQELLDAQLQVKAARADLANTLTRLQGDLMTQKAGAATVRADYRQAQLQERTDRSLYDLGVISGLAYSASKGRAEELTTRSSLENERLTLNDRAISTQMAVQQTKVDQAMALLGLKEKQVDALSVRAGISGVLVDLPHEVGEHVAPGATLAKVVQPDQLKASLKIAQTQAQAIQIGQAAEIDTHNGVIGGKVTRIDPAVVGGTVTVDIELTGALPQGARPDLAVDGTIVLDRMLDVVYVGRPAFGTENSTINLFRLSVDAEFATRVQVTVGRASVDSIQILGGLQPGDRVILSDASHWDSKDTIRLK